MANNLENKNQIPPEYSANFKKDIISFIVDTAVPKILKNCAGKDSIDDQDIAQEIGWMLEGYEKSNVVKEILDIQGYQDWDAFHSEVTNIVSREARKLKKKNIDIPAVDEESGASGRKLYRGEINMMNILLGEVFTALREKHLTTEDYDFGTVSKKIIDEILNKREVEKVTDESGREQMRRQITAIVNESFTPEALAEYMQKKKMKGKKYPTEERPMLLQVIEETIERVSIIMENKNLDADENLKSSEKLIPSDFSERDIGKVRRLIKSVLAKALTKNSVNPEGQENYIKYLTPLILNSLKKKISNPTETILKNLYEK